MAYDRQMDEPFGLIRDFSATGNDYPETVRIFNQIQGEDGLTVEALRTQDEGWPGDTYRAHRWVAVSNDGDVIGCCDARHVPNQFDPSRYSVLVFVSPRHQRRGWGTRLLRHAEAVLKPLGAREFIGEAKANAVGSLAFLGKHGFEETHRLWESHLDVALFDPSRFSAQIARTASAGVTIRTLANERLRIPDCIERLHALHTGIEADVPRPVQANAVSIETFTWQVTDHPTIIPEASLRVPGRGICRPHVFAPGSRTSLHPVASLDRSDPPSAGPGHCDRPQGGGHRMGAGPRHPGNQDVEQSAQSTHDFHQRTFRIHSGGRNVRVPQGPPRMTRLA